jgi:uncharacterized protein (DUF1330 family)
MAYERVMGLEVIDDRVYQQYRDAMAPILKSYGGAFGFDFRVSEVLLSKTQDPINRLFTIAFPSQKHMEAFFSNADYLAVKAMYFDTSVKSKTIISLYEIDV